MARGRFISNYIIEDREFNELSNDTCRLAYVFLITLADREGRITGELGYLTSKLFPRRREITTEILNGFIQEWANAGFVIWYESENGHKALQLINFEKHQRGLRKDREPSSEFDNPDGCRIIAGCISDYNQQNKIVKELKDKESLINNTNTNINIKSAKNAAIKPALSRKQSGNNKDDSLFNACMEIYQIKKGLPITDGRAFVLMIAEFQKYGVTAEDYAAAIDAMDADKNYKGTRPTSYKKWAIGYRDKRKRSDKKRDADQNPDSFRKSWLKALSK